MLACVLWTHDPPNLKVAVSEIDAARNGLEKARQRSRSRNAIEAIERAIAELAAYREPMAEHLREIDYRRANKNWAAYEIAKLACNIFERWIGGEIHARRDPNALGDAEPGAGFPTFVKNLLDELAVEAHWERPTLAAVEQHGSNKR